VVATSDNDPTKSREIPESPGWDGVGGMPGEQEAAHKYDKYLEALYAEQRTAQVEAQLPIDAQSQTPGEAPSLESKQEPDQFDPKLAWAIEYIDEMRQQGQEPERGPTLDASQGRPQGYYDELKAAMPSREESSQSQSIANERATDPMAAYYEELTQAVDVQRSQDLSQHEQTPGIER